MRAVIYRFPSVTTLQDACESLRGSGDLPLPEELDSPKTGEWVLASFCVEAPASSFALAARICDVGAGPQLQIEGRDRIALERFSRGEAPPSTPPNYRTGEFSPAAGLRVLVIENNEDVERILCGFLEDAGFLPVTVGSPQDALTLLVTGSLRAAIVDSDLSAMCGLEFCRSLRGLGVSVPVLILAGDDSSDDVRAALDIGATDLLPKPFRAPELHARLHGLLQRAS